MSGKIRVFIAMSLDGFIAGPNNELDWLDGWDGVEDTFTPFFAEVGALWMGRRTFDVIAGFEPWPYGETPVLVATNQELVASRASVRAVRGTVGEMAKDALEAAGGKDVYVDGGALIRSALSAGWVDELHVTLIPIVLGAGIPLFAGLDKQTRFRLTSARPIGAGFVALTYVTVEPP